MSHSTWMLDLGRRPYMPTFDLQKALQERQIAGDIGPGILLVEHAPVVTVSKRATEDEIIAPRRVLERRGITVAETDRGGQVTYHGPGQIVAYLLLNVRNHGGDLHEFLRLMEESVIQLVSEYDLKPYRSKGRTGVWIGKEKICAMGIHVRKWWTTHGLAFNVNTDLNHFGMIIPCGIRDRGVTSLERLLEDKAPSYEEAREKLLGHLSKQFELNLRPTTFDALGIDKETLAVSDKPKASR